MYLICYKINLIEFGKIIIIKGLVYLKECSQFFSFLFFLFLQEKCSLKLLLHMR